MARKRKQTIIWISPTLIARAHACHEGRAKARDILGEGSKRQKLTRTLLVDHTLELSWSDWKWFCNRFLKGDVRKFFRSFDVGYRASGGEMSYPVFHVAFAHALGEFLNLPY